MRTQKSLKSSLRRAQGRRRIRAIARKRARHARVCCRARRSVVHGATASTCCSKVSAKLQALKSLIPSHNGEIVKADQLFKETADYIILLRTQVVILQKLIESCGPKSEEQQNDVS